MPPTEVAARIPIINTGKVRLELKPPSVTIPVKGSILMSPGIYQVIAHPVLPLVPVVIANINYAINGFRVIPAGNSVKDARFAVEVNLSEH